MAAWNPALLGEGGVLFFGGDELGKVGVGVLPGGEEGFVGFFRGGFVAGEGVGAGEAELRLGVVLDANERVAFVLEGALEGGDGVGAVVEIKVGKTAEVGGPCDEVELLRAF
jgi:hypothetical protein